MKDNGNNSEPNDKHMEEDDNNLEPSVEDSEELPDVRAFNDEFTRSFLQTTEETRSGYYPFVSGTATYKMDFPQGGVIGEKGYLKKEEDYESFLVGVDDDKGIESSIKVNYYSNDKSGEEVVSLNQLRGRLETNLKFKKTKFENRSIYLAPFSYEDSTYGFAAFIQNERKNGGIQIVYTSECTSEMCVSLKDNQMKKIRSWIKSIEFIQKEVESE
ncbi:hypothetical protein [Virgibacillus necropolis]|uniref:Uncharacterized protein n=1 Tax=Virgibacillus necropolis TaxID=163877 RepID=A0A221MEU2_9BACI|nr:hypothetical protein [Virgibacillus necropolis]ASN06089.1 hypothetical protein CFK40_14215 [Virgibacillus necropolis]